MVSDTDGEVQRPRMKWRVAGQLLGALSIVLSLLFVGYEIRQNTVVARYEAYRSIIAEANLHAHALAVDDRLPGLFIQANEGARRDEFTDEEQFRMDMSLLGLLRVQETKYRAVTAGILDEEILETAVPSAGVGGASPYTTQFFEDSWSLYRTILPPDFSSFMERRLTQ